MAKISNDSFDLDRIKKALKETPELKIIMIANKKDTSKLYWELIEENLCTKKKPWIIGNNPYDLDGIPISNSLVLLINRWWENRNAINFIKHFIGLAELTLPITHIPSKD